MRRLAFFMLMICMGVVTGHAELIRLKDGSVINGRVIEQKDNVIVIESSLGRMTIQKYQLLSIDYEGGQSGFQNPQSPQGLPSQNNNTDRSATIYRLEKMIEQGKVRKWTHQNELKKLAAQLPSDYNQLIYKRFEKKNALFYSVLNIVPTLGSLMQGDYWGVALISLGYLSAYYLEEMSWFYTYSYDPYGSYYYTYGMNADFYTASVVVFASTLAFSLIRPYTFKNRYNKRLQNALIPDITVSRGDVYKVYTYNDSVNMPLFTASF